MCGDDNDTECRGDHREFRGGDATIELQGGDDHATECMEVIFMIYDRVCSVGDDDDIECFVEVMIMIQSVKTNYITYIHMLYDYITIYVWT